MGRQSTEKGFTILEAMVAIAILSLGMLAIGTMLTTSLFLDRWSTQDRNAQVVAIEKIEYLRKLPRNTDPTLATSVTNNPELVGQNQDCMTYYDYGNAPSSSSHPEEAETLLDTDFSKRNLYARRWVVSRLYWNDPNTGTEVDSGLLQVDIVVGWPVKGACTNTNPTYTCKRFLEMTTFFRPLVPPTAP